MNHKSKIEDMLLEMIQPKLTEIEERFSRGEGLTGEDVNTLLLKSQFNQFIISRIKSLFPSSLSLDDTSQV